MEQEVQELNIKDLILWTENPRDPVDPNASNNIIIKQALKDSLNRWNLSKLAKQMGPYFDFSELPIVVYHGKLPVVYDGNRRIILGKLKHEDFPNNEVTFPIPEFPSTIPCNVCSKEVALSSIYRKHADSGSWAPLERDIFLHKHMNEKKSVFLIVEECTGLISSVPYLNKGYVKNELLKEDNLKKLGFTIKDEQLYSIHNSKEANFIFSDLSNKIKNKNISTRKNRGKILEVLEPSSQKLIEDNQDNPYDINDFTIETKQIEKKKQKVAKRTKTNQSTLFGGKLYLKMGSVSDLYRDIKDLYNFYISNQQKLSQYFTSLIRMSLRLLCETAAKEYDMKLTSFLDKYFQKAKTGLDKDMKTLLSNHNVTKDSIIQLLHTDAHNYSAAKNLDQTLAMSIIIGAIVSHTHGQGSK